MLAQALGIPEVVIPAAPAVGSALGLLVTDVHVERTRSWFASLSNTSPERVWEIFTPLAADGEASLLDQGFTRDRIQLEYFAHMRYEGQSHELRIRLPRDAYDLDGLDAIGALFHEEHERAYGFSVDRREYRNHDATGAGHWTSLEYVDQCASIAHTHSGAF